MDIKEEIKVLVARNATTLTEIACKIKKNSGKSKRAAMNSLTQKFYKGTLRFNEADEILRILGYEFKIEKIK